MNLLDILSVDCVKAPLIATEKRDAINELIDTLAQAGKVNDPDALKEAVWLREQTRTTGIGQGLAIQHGKSDCVDKLVMAIGKPATPIDFESIDKQPVQLIVLLASPPDRTSDHIQALARISRLMTMREFRERVYAAQDADELYGLLESQEVTAS